MNALLLKFWTWFKEKNHAIILIILLLLFGMGTTIYFQRQSIANYKNKYETEVKLKNALLDTVHVYQNAKGEWVAEKLTIQETIKNLTKMYGQLTDAQKELIDRVKELDKKNDVIAAALIQANVKIDTLLHKGTVDVDTTNKKITFAETKNPFINYHFEIRNVVPAIKTIEPSLLIKDLYLPNKAMVTFQFDKVKGNPISLSVSNSNPYVHIANIESYAIPGLNPDMVKPTGWQKTWGWIKRNGTIIVVGVGAAAAGHYLIK